jgi:glutaminyl-peptide cyclotransferase
MMFARFSALVLALAACSAVPAADTISAEPPVYSYRIEAAFPHDPGAFTQGLFYLDGNLYESTGLHGRSTIRKVRIDDGAVLQSTTLPAEVFGEGIVNWGGEIISITWQNGEGYRWDRASLRRTGEFRYPGEGWGLTQDGAHIIMSDGTPFIRFLDPATLREVRRIEVTSGGWRVARLNELEYVRGEIYANVWQTNRIARIDPATGQVKGWIDLSGLVEIHPRPVGRRRPQWHRLRRRTRPPVRHRQELAAPFRDRARRAGGAADAVAISGQDALSRDTFPLLPKSRSSRA